MNIRKIRNYKSNILKTLEKIFIKIKFKINNK
jgi:hypothetical protein